MAIVALRHHVLWGWLCRVRRSLRGYFMGHAEGSWQGRTKFMFPQALLSLQSAINKEMPKRFGKHIKLHFACDFDTSCQKVLCDTYSSCVFTNIMDFDPKKKQLWCVKHQKLCSCELPVTPKSYLASDSCSRMYQRTLIQLMFFEHQATHLSSGLRVNVAGLGLTLNLVHVKAPHYSGRV